MGPCGRSARESYRDDAIGCLKKTLEGNVFIIKDKINPECSKNQYSVLLVLVCDEAECIVESVNVIIVLQRKIFFFQPNNK